ncbi:MAG: 4-hydroxythreonine-4-phosphate dehydrogenase PdxA [Hyphomicrobiaceae bacterium]
MTDNQKWSAPRLALAMGDPSGISPELTAGLLDDAAVSAAAQMIVIGDRRVLGLGEAHAGVRLNIPVVGSADEALATAGTVFWDLGHLDPETTSVGEVSLAGGQSAITNFRSAIALARDGLVDGVCFTPFNKAAMRLAHSSYEDEIVFISEELGFHGKASEFNILEGLWNARVTSHIPLADVSKSITREAILENIELTQVALVTAGVAQPRIGVAALNPHAGDNGNFGREEIDIIGPAVEEGQRRGWGSQGPFPSDTVFVRAVKGQYDAVLTMYHDQGQIAMKLIGFDKGVTLLGGFAFPICTPAHGTAYDIAGKGVANLGASRNAILLAAQMARASAA